MLKIFATLKTQFFILIFSILFIIAYHFCFISDYRCVFYHIFVVFSLLFLFTVSGLLLSFKINRVSILTNALLWASLIVFLLFAYTLAWSGRKMIDTPLPLSTFISYARQAKSVAGVLGLSFNAVLTVTIVFFLSLFISFIAISNKLFNDLIVLRKILYNLSFQKKITISVVISVFFLIVVERLQTVSLYQRLFRIGEPLGMVYLETVVNMPFDDSLINISKEYPKVKQFEKKNVIFIVVDALRADIIGAYQDSSLSVKSLTPFIDSLVCQKGFKKVEYVFSSSSYTYPGTLSLLRSKPYYSFKINDFAIHDLLKKQGYKINFILSGDYRNFYNLKAAFGTQIDYYYDGPCSSKYYLNDDSLVFEGLKKLEKYSNIPNFMYFNFMAAHSLGLKDTTNANANAWSIVSKDSVLYSNNYKKGVSQVDNYIKGLFHLLKEKGYLNNSVIVITSDHGQSLGEHGIFDHGKSVYNGEIRIPLLIYDSEKLTKKIYNLINPAMQEDISATIIDCLDLPIPLSWQGKSIMGKEKREFSFHNMAEYYALIHYKSEKKMYKYCYNVKNKKEELFELYSDIKENKNIINDFDVDEINSYRKKLNSFMQNTNKMEQ